MEIILLLPVLVIGGVWVGNLVWNAILQSSAATKAVVDQAWNDARSGLNGEPDEYGPVIRFRTRVASFRIVQGDEGIGQHRKRFGQRLAERWLDLFAGVLRLGPEIGFDATDPRLKLVGTTRLAHAVRRGRVWLLELVGEHEGCRVVLRTEDEPIPELSFPGLSPSAEHVGQALEAKEMSPGGVYR